MITEKQKNYILDLYNVRFLDSKKNNEFAHIGHEVNEDPPF